MKNIKRCTLLGYLKKKLIKSPIIRLIKLDAKQLIAITLS